MEREALRQKLRSEVMAVDATALLPHHRRGELLTLSPDTDLLEAALAIASDDTAEVHRLMMAKRLYKPSLSQLADWCVDGSLRFQFLILQPYVVAQPLARGAN